MASKVLKSMGILTVAGFTAIGYYIILHKILGRKTLVKTQTIWDLVFTIGIPILFIGTFSGLATAVIAGVIFSLLTAITPKPDGK